MGTIQNVTAIPLVAILSEVERDLMVRADRGSSLRGGDIVSSFDDVVRIHHRLQIDSLPSGVKNYYFEAKQRFEVLYKMTEVSTELKKLSNL